MLWYGDNALFAASSAKGAYDKNAETIGVIRTALRKHQAIKHGLITDLFIDTEIAESELRLLEDSLIQKAEEFLLKAGVTKIDAVVPDGQKISAPFLRNGYWASRKTVAISWDLNQKIPLDSLKPEATSDISITVDSKFDGEEVADFILSSYQPYWRWWKDDALDRIWERIDYPVAQPDEVEQQTMVENRRTVLEMLHGASLVIERKKSAAGSKIIGLCDALAAAKGETFNWGVLLTRDHPGKGFGKMLLGHALQWLQQQGIKKASVLTTSGLDDYDPTVYLYTQSFGGTIQGEFLDLVKRNFQKP